MEQKRYTITACYEDGESVVFSTDSKRAASRVYDERQQEIDDQGRRARLTYRDFSRVIRTHDTTEVLG